MTDREIALSKLHRVRVRLWLHRLVRWGTPSRVVIFGRFVEDVSESMQRQRRGR